MGYYIQGPPLGKAEFLVDNHEAEIVNVSQARDALASAIEAPVCVVHNGLFEAAGLCFSAKEFSAFADPGDSRIKTWLVMDREEAYRLSGYSQPIAN